MTRIDNSDGASRRAGTVRTIEVYRDGMLSDRTSVKG